MIKIKMKRLHQYAEPPFSGHDYPLAYDLSCVGDNTFVDTMHGKETFRILKPMEAHIFHTGWAFEIPVEYGVIYKDRSSMGAKRLIHHTAGGIDPTYRGEYLVSLINLSGEPRRIYVGDRIIQMVLIRRTEAEFVECNELNETVRGEQGFGSTGE